MSLAPVAIAAADVAFEIMRDIFKRRTAPVHVGFGAGATAMLVAQYLAERLRSAPLPLVVHALSSGHNVTEPETAPVSFLSVFKGLPEISYVIMYGPAYVEPRHWDAIRGSVGISEAFDAKQDIDLVITALATRKDPHGELNRFMSLSKPFGAEARRILDDEEHREGDVLYRPFSATGPITRQPPIRPVTLFEIDELVGLAADPDKAVLLVAGPCGGCRESRSDALLPLLRQPSLDVWSHLVLDDVTAGRCLQAV
jgi:hypothetical protein